MIDESTTPGRRSGPTPHARTPHAPTSPAGPAISHWIDGSSDRHYRSLIASTVGIAVGDLLGARIDWRVYAVMGSWVVSNALVCRWAARPTEYERRLRRYAMTIVMDVALLGVAYFYLDAVRYIGAAFFAYMAYTASATLPRSWAVGVSAMIVAEYSLLVVLAANGVGVASPIGLAPLEGNRLFAVGGIASVIVMVGLFLHLQSRMVRSVRDTERRYVSLVQSAADMVMTFDADGRIMDVNPATLEQTGYTWAELKQLPNRVFFPAAEWPAVLDVFRKTLEGESHRNDVRFVRRDGTERWAQTSTSPVVLDGQPAVMVIARDVTESRRHAEELREKDSRLRLVLGALNVGLITFDRDKRVTSVFGAWAREQASAHVQQVGAPLREVLDIGTIVEQHGDSDDRVLAGEDVTVLWRHNAPDGDRWYRTNLVPLRDADGTITGAAGLWVDETALALAEREREQLRQRVADAERIESLGKLVSGVAHELNNPLAAILNFTEDLLADDRSPEERVALEVIQAQALRSRTIVRDLLTYARQGSSRPFASAEPREILEAIARAMRPGLASQGVAFAVDLDTDDATLVLDRAGFEQVVTNLVTNAAHAAGAGGTVRLSSRVRRDAFEVIVEDNGAGITADVFPRMFEPFFTTKPTGQGVGLGLSVSMGIMKAHGGTLAAENRSAEVGGGARFIMRLPRTGGMVAGGADAPIPERRLSPANGRAPIPEPISGPRAMPQRKPTVLIIDDEDAIRQGLKRYLTRRGWAVEESADGADALSKLLRPEALRIYDVVLCDLKMAGVSGMDVYDRIKSAAPSIARRFILSTGDTTAPDVTGFLSKVDVPILEKPFELATLEAMADQIRSGS